MSGIISKLASSLTLSPNASYEAYDVYCSLPGLIGVKKNGKNAVLAFDSKDNADYATTLVTYVKGISVFVNKNESDGKFCKNHHEEKPISSLRTIKPNKKYSSDLNAFDFFIKSTVTGYTEKTSFVERVYREKGNWEPPKFFFPFGDKAPLPSPSSSIEAGPNALKAAENFSELQPKSSKSAALKVNADEDFLFSELPPVPDAPSSVTAKAFNFELSPVSVAGSRTFSHSLRDLPINLPSEEEAKPLFSLSIDEHADGDVEKMIEMEDDEQPLSKLAKLGKRKEPSSSSI